MTEEAAEAKTESKDSCSSKGAGLSELYKRQRLNAERPEADFWQKVQSPYAQYSPIIIRTKNKKQRARCSASRETAIN